MDALDDTRVGPGAVAAEDFDGDEVGAFGDAVGQAARGAGDMGAVAVAVAVGAAGVVDAEGRARGRAERAGRLEVGVGDQNARVNDVG